MTITVKLAELCDAAAYCLGGSYAKEYNLTRSYPYPYREIKHLQALQHLCKTILKLAKIKPKPTITLPVRIWNDLQLGKLECQTTTC